MKLDTVFDCGKCSGKGYINGLTHYANGVCFQCDGSGKIDFKTLTKKASIYLEYFKSSSSDELRYQINYPNGESDGQLIVDFNEFNGDKTPYRKLWLEWEKEGKTVVNIM
jgi:DnaJ-class molecular chaperone